jgi:hypothetical protein
MHDQPKSAMKGEEEKIEQDLDIDILRSLLLFAEHLASGREEPPCHVSHSHSPRHLKAQSKLFRPRSCSDLLPLNWIYRESPRL